MVEDCKMVSHENLVYKLAELTGWSVEVCEWCFDVNDHKVHVVYKWPEGTLHYEQNCAYKFEGIADPPRYTNLTVDPESLLKKPLYYKADAYYEVCLTDIARWLLIKGAIPDGVYWIH